MHAGHAAILTGIISHQFQAVMCVRFKTVRLILLWSFLSYFGYYFSVFSSIYLLTNILTLLQNTDLSNGVFVAPMFLFIPLAGWIGDVKRGRYKTLKGSLLFLTIMSLIPIAVSCVNLVLLKHPALFTHSGAKVVAIVLLFFLVVVSIIGFVSFAANVIPFAMDQLRDAPAQDSSVFISWYVWTLYLGLLTNQLIFLVISEKDSMFKFPETSNIAITIFVAALSVIVLTTLVIFRCLLQKWERWFNTEPCKVNPYKMVYEVTKFAYQHKIPIHRSAFTYCEDELPSRLDLGKSKYGGPFSTEQVEDVKVFYGILKVQVSIGPVLYLANSGLIDDSTLSFQLHSFGAFNSTNFATLSLINTAILYALIVVAIPSFLLLFKLPKFFSFSTFRSLTRLEMVSILILVIMLFKLGVNIAFHMEVGNNLSCVFRLSEDDPPAVFSLLEIVALLLVEDVLASCSLMLLNVSFFEFICAQSPYSMKGMLIGLGFAIQGVFNLLGPALKIPFRDWKYSFFSCGFVYYSMNVVIGIFSFLLLTCVAKRYKYRERDEPSRERQFAEEYYSRNIERELFLATQHRSSGINV